MRKVKLAHILPVQDVIVSSAPPGRGLFPLSGIYEGGVPQESSCTGRVGNTWIKEGVLVMH